MDYDTAGSGRESGPFGGPVFLWKGESHNLARDDLIKLEGRVTKTLGGGHMEVETEDGVKIRAMLSGRLKRFKIRVLVGDRVEVAVSPYDPTHGLITYRLK
jgi:translation initiation factor IF-1